MKVENRVFFKDEQEALENGYRPCGACLPEKYKLWKEGKPFAGIGQRVAYLAAGVEV